MKNITPVLVLHNIQPVNGGATYAVMLRADALASICKKVVVYTFGFDFDFHGSVSFWKDKLDNFNKIEFINIFEEKAVDKQDAIMTALKDGDSRIPDRNNPKAYRVFIDGVYRRYEGYTASGYLSSIDHFEAPWVRVSKSVFSKTGARIVEHYMDKQTNKVAFSAYFTSGGKPVYSCNYNKETGKPSVFFDHIYEREYSDFNFLVATHLETLCNSYQNVALFLEKREFVQPCVHIKTFKKIFVLHNSHLEYPCDDWTKIGPSMKPVFDNMQQIDKFVTLTLRQKKHLEQVLDVGNEKLMVINHPQKPVPIEKQQPFDFHNHIVSSVARYHSQKNLRDAIKAFKIVTTVLPDAIYNIYGYGPEEKALQSLINELGLQNNVFLKGFTTNTEEVYQNSCLTLLSSVYEGQPLVLGESLSYGTPVVSYDINYGPAEVIQDGVNGFLVKKYDINALAEKILLVLLNKELRQELSKNARLITERLTVEKFKESWIDVLS